MSKQHTAPQFHMTVKVLKLLKWRFKKLKKYYAIVKKVFQNTQLNIKVAKIAN